MSCRRLGPGVIIVVNLVWSVVIVIIKAEVAGVRAGIRNRGRLGRGDGLR